MQQNLPKLVTDEESAEVLLGWLPMPTCLICRQPPARLQGIISVGIGCSVAVPPGFVQPVSMAPGRPVSIRRFRGHPPSLGPRREPQCGAALGCST